MLFTTLVLKGGKNMYLPSGVEKILERFNENNIEAYTVGGSVRDSLLLRKPEDFDITTAADPDKVTELFSDLRVISTGKKHGTVTVISDSLPVEITTYRSDGEYSDHRHPDRVTFSLDLKEDLARRDFTINAIFYCPEKGYFDPFGGKEDLKAKIIRTVGEPERRFFEDALRILRALRFSATLDFEIEPLTESAIFSNAELLKTVSKERVFCELKKLMVGDSAHKVLGKYLSVLSEALPNLKPYKSVDFPIIDRERRTFSLCLAAFFIRIDKDNAEEIAKSTLNTLKSDNKTKTEVLTLISYFNRGAFSEDYEIKRAMGEISVETTLTLINLFEVLGEISQPLYKKLELRVKQIVENGECFKISQLEINGNDILNIGIKPQIIGKILNRLLNDVIYGKCSNDKAQLLKTAVSYIEREEKL